MAGRLIYLMGASGCGKDTLLAYARERCGNRPGLVFAHRYITRPADAGGENHVALSADEFAARRRAGLFAIDWDSHGHSYGLGVEIDQWLAAGLTVVANGSRQHLPQVQQRFPDLVPVLVEVSEPVLRMRLYQRGRETPAQIDERLRHHAEMAISAPDSSIVISNDRPLAQSGEAFVALLSSLARKEEQCE
jgi:ribose 1,5-bisphosphokinase